jgi:hypothetical protein
VSELYGVIATQFARPLLDDAEPLSRRLALTALRRAGEPDEIAPWHGRDCNM